MSLRPSHLSKASGFRARRVFTDREDACEAFLEALRAEPDPEAYKVLSLHGVGGQGKSALGDEFLRLAAREDGPAVARAKVNFDVARHRQADEALLQVRLKLRDTGKLPFPTFDFAFVRYQLLSYPGTDVRKAYPQLFVGENEILQDMVGVAGDLASEIPGVSFIYKYASRLHSRFREWWRRRGSILLEGLDELSQEQLLEALPKFLGADLYAGLFPEEGPRDRRAVVILDTYEALWRDSLLKTGAAAWRVDGWVRRLVEESPGVLFILSGRDRISWEEIDSDWEGVVEPHLLGGLSDGDADAFLRKVPIEEAEVRREIVRSAAGLPFYLSLQVDQYEDLKAREAPVSAESFGGPEGEVIARFCDHLDDRVESLLRVLAQPRQFDEALYLELSREFFGGAANVPFHRIVGRSFVEPRADHFVLHALMRDYLFERTAEVEPELFRQVHTFLFEHYDRACRLSDEDEAELFVKAQDAESREGWLRRREQFRARIERSVEQLRLSGFTLEHEQAFLEAAYHLEVVDPRRFVQWSLERDVAFRAAGKHAVIEPIYRRALAISEASTGEDLVETARSANALAMTLQALGDPGSEVEGLYRRALAVAERLKGPEHPDTADYLGNLSLYLGTTSDFGEAEAMARRALKITEEALGKEDPDTALRYNNLGAVLEGLGRYREAEPYFRRALEIDRKALGNEHFGVALPMGNLGRLSSRLGRSEEAERLCREALEITEKQLGPEHPDTAIHLSLLVGALHAANRSKEAEPLARRALEITEKVSGTGSPQAARRRHDLASVLLGQGRAAESEALYRQALATIEKVFGPRHLDAATALSGLSELLRRQGRYAEAEEIARRAALMTEEILGAEHPRVAYRWNDWATVLQDQGKYAEAEALFRRSLALSEQSLGPQAEVTGTRLNNLGLLLQQTGKLDEAEPLLLRALQICEASRGPEHPLTAVAQGNLAALFKVQGRLEEAEALLRKAYETAERALGEQHPKAVIQLNNLALVLQERGRLGETERLLRKVLDIQEKTLGPEHPDRAAVLNNIAWVLEKQGHREDAEPLFLRALELLKSAHGPYHPDVATVLYSLASLLERMARPREAESYHRQALEALEESLGPEHPFTRRQMKNLADWLVGLGRYEEAGILYSRAGEEERPGWTFS